MTTSSRSRRWPSIPARAGVTQKELLDRIRAKTARIGIVGMGYVGLPLVRVFADAGFRVTGFDVDEDKVRKLNAGRSYIKHIPSAAIGRLVRDGQFQATLDMAQAKRCHAILVCVPTPLNEMREPNMTYIESTMNGLAPHLQRGQSE